MSVLPATPDNVAVAADRLSQGLLVAMPTETVYGLGADALNAAAAKRIFEVKGRPPTDPLIVHIVDPALTETLWDVDAATRTVANALATLWPGPLTLVARAAEVVPTAVTGGSGFVGLRIPRHAVARALIETSKKCIAAPSANTFGHVSPTTAAHVAADLIPRDSTLTVLDGGSCDVGIESTVVKLTSAAHIEVLRRGAVSCEQIVECLAKAGLADGAVAVTVRDTRSKYATDDKAMDGPGQLLTHYSPSVPSFLLSPASFDSLKKTTTSSSPSVGGGASSSSSTGESGESECRDRSSIDITASVHIATPSGDLVPLSQVLVLDFGGALKGLEPHCLALRSLSADGQANEACQQVFDALRWTESVEGARAVVLPLLTEFSGAAGRDQQGSAVANGAAAVDTATTVALLEAVEDRLFRAASGRRARLVSAEGP